MQRISRVRGPLALAIVLIICVALGGAFAWAEGDTNPGGVNQLQVDVAEKEGMPELAAQAVPIHAYRIASASKDPKYDTYNYTFDVPGFDSLGKDYDQTTFDQWDYQALADSAKRLVEENNISPTASLSSSLDGDISYAKFDGLADGLYLVLADTVFTSRFSYAFIPTIVSLPAKVGADGMPVYNTSEGRWTNTDPIVAVQILLKHEEEQLYGDLVVNKTVSDFSGEPATFVFHVYDTETNGDVYDNYVAVQFADGETASAVLPHIPAGIPLTVEEDYSGGRYQATTGPQPVVIKANEEVGVGFTNTRVDGPSGHGIENRYTYDGESGNWGMPEPNALDASEAVPVSS